MSFKEFIFTTPKNRQYLFVILAGSIALFILFKILYPFPDFFSDSYSYIYAAQSNRDVSIWPIGYSKFIRWFHIITSSDTALVTFQFSLYIASALYFFFSILYLYRPEKSNELILLIFLFFNPLFLYIANYVNSDPLFLTLSILWFTELLWIIKNPKKHQIITQAILLFMCFTVRNNAYFYPIISCIAFLISVNKTWIWKTVGSSLGIILIVPFILHTRNEAYKLTGIKQFSLFTGWQLANNALYMTNRIPSDSNQLASDDIQKLKSLSAKYIEKVQLQTHGHFSEVLNDYVGNFYIREADSPLKQYLRTHYSFKDETGSVIAWGKASGVFEQYGKELIKNNPGSFIRNFVLLNTKNYFLPPLEKLEVYNLGSNKVWPVAQKWFHYPSNKVTSVSKSLQKTILYPFPSLFLFLNLFLIGYFLYYQIRKKNTFLKSDFDRALLISMSFWALNFLFSILTSIIVLRYECFPMIISISFGILTMDKVESFSKQLVLENKENKLSDGKISPAIDKI